MNALRVPTRIINGENTLNDIKKLVKGCKSCLFVCTNINGVQKETFNKTISLIESENVKVSVLDEVTPNPKTEIIEKGIKLVNNNNVDCIVALGGGSTLDSAKAIRLLHELDEINWEEIFANYNNPFCEYPKLFKKDIKLIAIPTTVGTGSEVTQAAVLTNKGFKYTLFHQQNFYDFAILDPILILSLPKSITASTSFDAFTHAYESFINKNTSEFTKTFSKIAINLITQYLPKSLGDLNNINYRNKLLIGQNLAGISLASGGAHLPHPLSEVIGSYANIPHGESLSCIFTQYLKEYESEQTLEQKEILDIFNTNLETDFISLEEAVSYFINLIGLKSSLKDYDINEDTKNKILNDELWNLLPFANSDTIKTILNNSFTKK